MKIGVSFLQYIFLTGFHCFAKLFHLHSKLFTFTGIALRSFVEFILLSQLDAEKNNIQLKQNKNQNFLRNFKHDLPFDSTSVPTATVVNGNATTTYRVDELKM